jgi:hypothetical protein
MSHNRRTLQDRECRVLKHPLAQQRRAGVRKVAAVTPEIEAGIWLPAERFACTTPTSSPVHPNLQQSVGKNKTVGLVGPEGVDPDGR